MKRKKFRRASTRGLVMTPEEEAAVVEKFKPLVEEALRAFAVDFRYAERMCRSAAKSENAKRRRSL